MTIISNCDTLIMSSTSLESVDATIAMVWNKCSIIFQYIQPLLLSPSIAVMFLHQLSDVSLFEINQKHYIREQYWEDHGNLLLVFTWHQKKVKLKILGFYVHQVKGMLNIYLLACFQLGRPLCFRNRTPFFDSAWPQGAHNLAE